jgi:hypothetical protein
MAAPVNGRKEFTLIQTLIFDENGKLQMVGGGNKTIEIKLATINFKKIYKKNEITEEKVKEMEKTFENYLKNGWELLKIDNNEEPQREFYFKTKKDGDRTEFSLMKKQEPEVYDKYV